MGQQQLLLVILVTILVGIATVVAINTFGTAANSANVSAVRNDAAQIASDAQGQYIKPAQLGGAGKDWTKVSFKGMAFPSKDNDDKHAINQNGTYVINGGTAKLTITCYPASQPDYKGVLPTIADDGTKSGTDYTASAKKITYTVTQNDFKLVKGSSDF